MAGFERNRSIVERRPASVPVGLVIRPTRLPLTRSRCFSRKTSTPSLTLAAAPCRGASGRSGPAHPARINPIARTRPRDAGTAKTVPLRVMIVAKPARPFMVISPFPGIRAPAQDNSTGAGESIGRVLIRSRETDIRERDADVDPQNRPQGLGSAPPFAGPCLARPPLPRRRHPVRVVGRRARRVDRRPPRRLRPLHLHPRPPPGRPRRRGPPLDRRQVPPRPARRRPRPGPPG